MAIERFHNRLGDLREILEDEKPSWREGFRRARILSRSIYRDRSETDPKELRRPDSA